MRAQEGILAVLGRHVELLVTAGTALSPEDFDPGERRDLAEALWAFAGDRAGVGDGADTALAGLLDGPLQEPARGLAARLLLAEEWEGDPEPLLASCAATLRRVRLQERLDAIRASQRQLEGTGTPVPDDMKRETERLQREIADLKGRASGRAAAGGRV